MARDIAQEIINAIKSAQPDYVVTKLVQEREDKIKSENLTGKVPATSSILQTAAALALAGKNTVTGAPDAAKKVVTDPAADTQIYDSAENYDSYTLPLSYDYSSSASSGATSSTLSKVVGYAIVGLVLLVVADKLMGK